MAEPIKISTSKYHKDGKVDIDGNIWTVKLPGAGTELRLSQAQRRLKVLDKKLDSDPTEADADRYDELENLIYSEFTNMFSDGTEDNASVKKWIEETPMAVIMLVFEDLKEQANGQPEPTTGS